MPPKRRYEEIAAHFRRLIQDGELAPGDTLPSLRKVCEEFGVAIATANRAFQMLKAEGLTEATSEGTVVSRRDGVIATGVARLERRERTGKDYAPGETSSNHRADLRSLGDAKIAERLGMELYDEVLIRRRVFRTDGKPTSVGYSFFHPRAVAEVPELLQQGRLEPFWQQTYTERTGKEFSRSPEERTARLAGREELEDLEVVAPPEAAVPVLVVHTTFHTEDGPIEVWEDVWTPGSWQADTD
ncbi:GntR family transcriptional regulator [Streptomyces sp. NPDC047980]|uniref:GntR family transcriptional regulator n=1 Tax=Streptomyces sp. NPDC047980 TaxID=3365494 RepID=UPI00371E4207